VSGRSGGFGGDQSEIHSEQELYPERQRAEDTEVRGIQNLHSGLRIYFSEITIS
jgi:hypothetical protein